LSGWCRPATLRGMAGPERQQQVLELLKGLRGIEPLKQLFWSELNYQRVNEPLSRRGWTDSAAQALAEDPVLFAGGGENNDFHVIYGRLASDRLLLGAERPVVSRLLREHPYALFVFSNKTQDRWHFLNVKYDKAVERRQLFRRITVVPGDGLRTAGERIALLNLEEIGADRSPLTIQEHHDAAFDVEKVTKDFYAEIANWYFWACDHVTFPMPKGTANAEAYKAQSLIRLITRLIFCWFVKEKGLIPGELFDSRALAKLLKAGAALPASEETTYYKAILQNLFFATLNQEMGKREFRKRNAHGRDPHRGITNLYRYEDAFADPKAFLRLMDGIPFLNGGLFECLDKVYRAEEKLPDVRIDGFSDHPKNPLSVPDFLFFGDERTVDLEKAYGEKRYRQATVRGLIHTFGRYKFTITENTPLDQEVALDPELSGKVFENLLAAYNPETATTARKQTGSFYTPREIVDYMVDEALLAYLATKLNSCHSEPARNLKLPARSDSRDSSQARNDKDVIENKLRHLFAYNDEPHQFSPAEVKTLIAAIDNLKALDPACGSGAFPMGLLHKLVFILGKLDPHNEQWKQQQIAKASEIPDATVREKTLADIEQAFAANELDYGRKLYLIENCIYGVDIQPIAVQIAKMRFFISLIVEQKVAQASSLRNDSTRNQDGCATLPADNLGIRPLPNLETKFVAANTLIGIEKPAQQMLRNPLIDAKEAELRRVRERHFTARTPATKARCREQDAKLRAEISELLRADGFARETTEKLANWNPYDQNASADFFDPEWMFGIKDGFDVLIGNPPYIEFKKLEQQFKSQYEPLYESANGKYDIYVLFIEHAERCLSPRGLLAFINPTTFLKKDFGAAIRRIIAKRFIIMRILDFADFQVFDGVTNYTGVFVFQKGVAPKYSFPYHKYKRLNGATDPGAFAASLCTEASSELKDVINVESSMLAGSSWDFHTSDTSAILAKMDSCGQPLVELSEAIFQGIASGKDEVFYVDPETVSNWCIEKKVLLPLLKGQDVKRYAINWSHHYVIYPYDELSKPLPEKKLRHEFPKAYEYLVEHRALLQGRSYFDNSTKLWFELWNQRKRRNFERLRIVTPEISDRNNFALTDRYAGNTKTYHILLRDADDASYRFVLGLLNSRLLQFYYCSVTAPMAGGFYAYKTQFLEKLPIPDVPAEQQAPIVKLVDKILAAKRENPQADTSAWEREIDERVYRLYGLTAAEIKVVEEGGKR
jgi:adenine-specific DNA-methyltransferase